jgi:hypothetical protein
MMTQYNTKKTLIPKSNTYLARSFRCKHVSTLLIVHIHSSRTARVWHLYVADFIAVVGVHGDALLATAQERRRHRTTHWALKRENEVTLTCVVIVLH